MWCGFGRLRPGTTVSSDTACKADKSHFILHYRGETLMVGETKEHFFA